MPSASLKYADAEDRAYGLCGMALALYIYDAEQFIDNISIDAPADLGLTLSADFFAPSNPNLSVKAVWKESFRNFQILSAMVIGNVLSRSLSRRHAELANNVKSLVFSALTDEGDASCGLTETEVESVCSRSFDYIARVLRNPTVAATVDSMVRELNLARSLDRDRILAHFLPLQRL